ncbi:MAG: type II secretion system protein [Candidatus Acidiferrales bacterium]
MRWWHATRGTQAGMTLLELILACAILIVLASAAIPISRASIRHKRETDLRRTLREMREAIDRYKDAADRNLIQVEVGTEGYPPDLDTLVRGVTLAGAPDRRIRFLRRIPEDPMTASTDWGLRCVQDDPDSTSWCGSNVFDVYTRSYGTTVNGEKYSEW